MYNVGDDGNNSFYPENVAKEIPSLVKSQWNNKQELLQKGDF